jgi:hypothetical protein
VLDEAPVALLGGREGLAASEELLLGLRPVTKVGGVARGKEPSERCEQDDADEVPRSHDSE